MKTVADFHIHSKYSRACSHDSDLQGLSTWAKLKGITLQGTGDFSHPLWLKELKEKLKQAEQGLYTYNNQRFILSLEVCTVFPKKDGKSAKIHTIILTPSIEIAEQINEALSKFGDLKADARPTLMMHGSELIDIVKNISSENEIIPAHIWTPWFSVFGSKFGVDKIEEAYGEKCDKIIALETGLSSDPMMNWMNSKLDKYALVSNSDAHSPKNLGREANVFELKEISYNSIMDSLRTRKGFVKTYEFYPQEGKYYFDGHRNCNFSCSFEESEKLNNKCPVCKKPLTIGVLHRAFKLGDRKYKERPKNAVDFQYIVPLPKLIAQVLKKPETSRLVPEAYEKIIRYFGSEFSIYEASYNELVLATNKEMADAIFKVNKGEINWKPGYDGVFGEFSFGEIKEEKKPQTKLGDF